jgi:uncharacterized membrane protein YfcA
MPDPIGWVVLFVGALVGAVVGGVAGFGAGIIMLPLVSWAVGIRSAVPVLTVTMSIGIEALLVAMDLQSLLFPR